MKTRILILAINILLSIAFVQGQVVKKINVATPGSLSTLLGSDKTTVTDLTLTGTINGTDFTTIKQMTVLKNLDMSAVNITDGRMPGGTFSNKKMSKIILPLSLKVIGSGAFESATFSSIDFSKCLDLEKIERIAFQNMVLTEMNTLDFSLNTKLTEFTSLAQYDSGPFTNFTGHVILPKNMIELPKYIFVGFKGSVDLPSSLEVIGNNSFKKSEIKSILSLPVSLKIIGFGAFQSATSSGIDFSKCLNLEKIDSNVFRDLTLTEINTLDLSLNTKLTQFVSQPQYDSGPFTNFTGHVILPKSMTTLPNGLFVCFKGSIDLPPLLETIGKESFKKSEIKGNLLFPSTLKIIDDNAFYMATLWGMDFSKCLNLEKLGWSAFRSITLTEINTLDLSLNTKLTQLVSQYGASPFTDFTGHVILPGNMVALPNGLFIGFKGSVDLPSSLETIGKESFKKSEIKGDLLLPSTVKVIDQFAFHEAILPTGWILPSSLKQLGFGAFESTSIPRLDFSQCVELEDIAGRCFKNIKLTDNVLDFSSNSKLTKFKYWCCLEGAFNGYLGHVILPKDMTNLPPYTFAKFEGTLELPSGLKTIGTGAFQEAVLPKTFNLPSTVEVIETSAFQGVSLSTSLQLPPSLKRLGFKAFLSANLPRLDFSKCSDLEDIEGCCFKDIKLTDNVLDFSSNSKLTKFKYWCCLEGAFNGYSGHVILPRDMKTIPSYTFARFQGSVDFPSGLETISPRAFESAEPSKGLILPSSLKTIGDRAFYNATIPSIEFEGMDNNNLLCKPGARMSAVSVDMEKETNNN